MRHQNKFRRFPRRWTPISIMVWVIIALIFGMIIFEAVIRYQVIGGLDGYREAVRRDVMQEKHIYVEQMRDQAVGNRSE